MSYRVFAAAAIILYSVGSGDCPSKPKRVPAREGLAVRVKRTRPFGAVAIVRFAKGRSHFVAPTYKRSNSDGSGDCPSKAKRVPGRECLAERNEANPTIQRSRHRTVRERRVAICGIGLQTFKHSQAATSSLEIRAIIGWSRRPMIRVRSFGWMTRSYLRAKKWC